MLLPNTDPLFYLLAVVAVILLGLSKGGFFGAPATGFAAPAAAGGFGAPAGFGTPASQQINNPAVSPSLLLTQPGINPAIANQALIQPQLQLGNAVLGNQQQISALQSQSGLGQRPAR